MKALEAVAEAARKLETAVACKDRLLHHPQRALRAALLTLDALPADPAPAEVRGCVGVDGPSVYAYGAKRADETDDGLADQIRSAGYEPVCFFTVHAPTKVVIPDAPASTTRLPLVKGDGA